MSRKMRPLPAPIYSRVHNPTGSRLSTCPMFFVFQASTVAFDEINFRGSVLEVCWPDHSTPILAPTVCTAGPPMPAKASREQQPASVRRAGNLALSSSCLVSHSQP